MSERGNKLTIFECADARGFITYNGIGRDLAGQSPNDWLADNPLLARLGFADFAQAVTNIVAARLAPLAARGYDTRHSCVIAGYVNTSPILALASNYESLARDGWEAKARPDLSLEFMSLNSEKAEAKFLLATGSFPMKLKRRFLALGSKATRQADPKAMRARMTKLVRDVAYHGERQASVGTSVLTAIIPILGEAEISVDVVGGTTLLEMPNSITTGAVMKDIYIDTSGEPAFRYNRVHKKAVVKEQACAQCGGPVPEGYLRCGICDAATGRQGSR